MCVCEEGVGGGGGLYTPYNMLTPLQPSGVAERSEWRVAREGIREDGTACVMTGLREALSRHCRIDLGGSRSFLPADSHFLLPWRTCRAAG